MVVILAGNSLTVLSIVRHPRLATASNQFVLGLAAADMLVGLSMPYHMCFYLIPELGQHRGSCLLRFVLLTLASTCSIIHMCTIAADRYLAIVHPLRHAAIVTKRLARKVIAGSWLFSICVATVIIYWNEWQETHHCEIADIMPQGYLLLILLPLFSLLFLVLVTTYARIQRVAARQARRLSSPHIHLASSSSHWHAGRKSLQVVSLVLGCFCLCWLPFLVVGTLLVMGVEEPGLHTAYQPAFSFAMANSGMNPIIYAWKNKDFKDAFREILRIRRRRSVAPEESVRPGSAYHRSMSNLSLNSNKQFSTPPFCIQLPEPPSPASNSSQVTILE